MFLCFLINLFIINKEDDDYFNVLHTAIIRKPPYTGCKLQVFIFINILAYSYNLFNINANVS